MRVQATYTIKGFIPPFTDEVEVETAEYDNVRDALNSLLVEMFNHDRYVVREVVLIKAL